MVRYKKPDYTQGQDLSILKKGTPEYARVMREVERAANFMQNNGDIRASKIFYNALVQADEHNNVDYLSALGKMKHIPVSIDEFIESEDFLGGRVEIWPKLREELRAMKPDIMIGTQPILEVLNRSTIGTGKSELGKISILYDVYFTTCFHNPQTLFTGLNQFTPIVFVLQSVRDHITRRVLYQPLRHMFESIPYIQKYVEWNRDKESELILTNQVMVIPMVASPLHYIGQAVLGAHIDEANFMEVIAESKKAVGYGGMGGLYDQADEVYRSISRRRKSRFLTKGLNPGCIYVSSSVNYRDDFLDRRISEVEPEKDVHIRVVDYRQFDVKPNAFSGKTFKFLVGTNDYAPKILPDNPVVGVDYTEGGHIEEVPIEFEEDFRHDPDNAQRDILGIASSAIHRFISQVHKIVNAVQLGRDYGLKTFVHKTNVELSQDGFPQIIDANLPDDRSVPRFVHIDLSRSGDRCGIVMCKVAGHTAIEKNGVVEMLPTYIVEMAVSIQPDLVNHIDIAEVRGWVMLLKTYYGFNIKSVTYDGFDSQESMQMWRKAGVLSYDISMDKTSEPYDQLKQAIYQDRVLLCDNDILKTELATLEKHEKGGKSKIDHPPKGSKDIADALAGACKAASLDRVIRSTTNVTDTSGKQFGQMRKTAQRRTINRK